MDELTPNQIVAQALRLQGARVKELEAELRECHEALALDAITRAELRTKLSACREALAAAEGTVSERAIVEAKKRLAAETGNIVTLIGKDALHAALEDHTAELREQLAAEKAEADQWHKNWHVAVARVKSLERELQAAEGAGRDNTVKIGGVGEERSPNTIEITQKTLEVAAAEAREKALQDYLDHWHNCESLVAGGDCTCGLVELHSGSHTALHAVLEARSLEILEWATTYVEHWVASIPREATDAEIEAMEAFMAAVKERVE